MMSNMIAIGRRGTGRGRYGRSRVLGLGRQNRSDPVSSLQLILVVICGRLEVVNLAAQISSLSWYRQGPLAASEAEMLHSIAPLLLGKLFTLQRVKIEFFLKKDRSSWLAGWLIASRQ